jgi:hypothetical protein
VPNYLITMSPAPAKEVQVLLQGPGIDPDGKPYVFATTDRARSFADAVNFAYEQGLRDGMRRSQPHRPDNGPMLVVSGRTPDTLVIRKEGWWHRLKRHCRELSLRRG